jgi:predicted phage terminase large subunit-like protein
MAPRTKSKSKYKSDDFLADMAEFVQGLRDEIANAADLGEFDRSPGATRARREKTKTDFGFFCKTYFPHRGRAKHSSFHEWTFKRGQEIADGPGGAREAIAAPRGNAKSTFWTELFPLWSVITKRRRYPLILSDAIEVAAMMLEGIKTELLDNPRLAHDFPEAVGQGPVWQVGVIVTVNGTKIQCGGAGKRIRGARHGSQRPDLVILDDIENDENVASPAQRDKREAWIDRAVEPLGPPDGSMDMIYVGTVLHVDSVLKRKLINPAWNATTFKAIIQWPDRMDLWDQWEELYRNRGREAASAFLADNREAMHQGAEVLWPAVQTLEKLMVIRFRVGASFGSEYQNEPTDGDATFQHVQFWADRAAILREWAHFGAVDPSLGGRNKGRDPSAILVGAKDVGTGRLFVLEAAIRRRVPDRIINDVIALQDAYRCVKWAVEAIQFQEFLRQVLLTRSVERGIPVPAMAVKPHTDKVLRIESLQPYVDAGLILFHASHTTLREQLINFPNADHDDGPDCLEMLWQLAMGVGVAAGANAGGGPDRRGGRDEDDGQTERGMSNLARRFGGQARRILNLGRR